MCLSVDISSDVGGKDQERSKTDHNRVAESEGHETSEKDSSNDASVKKTKRRRSEDELELHPMVDWEEEREGGGGGRERVSSRKPSSRSSDSKRRSGGETKVSRTSAGEKEGEGRGGRKLLVSDVMMEKSGKDDDCQETAVKHPRTIKVCVCVCVCVCVRACVRARAHRACMCTILHVHVHALCTLQLSKSDDLRVLIARKKGERSAPPTYVPSRRYSLNGSEGEEEGEDERVGDTGKKAGLSSVVKVPQR